MLYFVLLSQKADTICLLLVLCLGSVCSYDNSSWNYLQKAIKEFDSLYFKAASHDVSTKAKTYLGKDTLSFVISPLWLELLLLTISLGSTGETLEELDKATFLNITKEKKVMALTDFMSKISQEDENLKLEMINMMFVRDDLIVNQNFSQFVTKTFNMTINNVDFSNIKKSVGTLNNMVARRTKRKMKEIFDENDLDSSGTSIIFVSSVYFKNRWLFPPTVLNGTWDFKLTDNGNHTKIKMYRVNGIMPFAYSANLDAQIVDIPFITPGISMLVFLPNKTEGLLKMEEEVIKEKDILAFADSLMKPTPVAVSLPRYALEMAVLLPTKLKMMGINKIFTTEAELGGMIEEGTNVRISNAIQRIKLWADAGRGAFKDTGDEELPKPEVIMFADHPFLFILKMNFTSLMMGHFLLV